MNKREYDGGKGGKPKSNWEIMEGIIGKKKAKEVRRSLGGIVYIEVLLKLLLQDLT